MTASKNALIALLSPYSGRNLGDGAIQTAFIAELRRLRPGLRLIGITDHPSRTAAIHDIPCHRLDSGWLAAWRILREVDLLLVAGGGQLDEEWGGAWGHPYRLWRWTMLASLMGKSVAFASVGLGTVQSALARHFIRGALRRAAYRSYRDAGTHALLEPLGFTRTDAVVPDVALGLPLPPVSRSAGQALTLGISPMIFGHPDLWARADEPTYRRYVTELALVLRWALRDGWDVQLFFTNDVDRRAADDMFGAPGLSEAEKLAVRTQEGGSLEALLPAMQSCDVILASRLHGVILAQRLHQPVVAISFDRKVDAQMEQSGLAALCLDIHTFRAAEVQSRLAGLKNDVAATKDVLVHYVAGAQAQLQQQAATLLALTPACSASP